MVPVMIYLPASVGHSREILCHADCGFTKAHSLTYFYSATSFRAFAKCESKILKEKRVSECTILILLKVVAHPRDDDHR